MRRSTGLLLAFSLAACGRDEPPPVASPSAQPSSPASLEPAAGPSALEPPLPPASTGAAPAHRAMPHPRRARLLAAVTRNASCVACHEPEASEWRSSRHHTANTNAAYARAFSIEPSPFCRGCHAPEADPARSPPAPVSELGVGCVSCHLADDGAVLAAPASGDQDRPGDELSPHPLRRSNDFAGDGGCQGCHEFRFPAALGDEDADLMQTTAREHRRSPSSDRPCASCHMPRLSGRRSHSFSEVRDPVWLRARVTAQAELLDHHTVQITLAQPSPAHGFPTGDLFRRLEIGAELRGHDGRALGRDVRHLTRQFVLDPGRPGRALLRDDRLFDQPRVIELSWAPPPTPASPAEIRWWVRLQRVATVGAGHDPRQASIESEVELHRGTLPLAR